MTNSQQTALDMRLSEWVEDVVARIRHEASGKRYIDSFLNESARPAFRLRWIVSTCGSARVAHIHFSGLAGPHPG